ncbi:hypothetical protein SAMN04488513_11820 [Pseudozobellia thermophila]|uniref:Uncharacterized protein n=1 Tax=Pseudozobellia thermophila TaxID=192903 RepID=A0A1M6P5S0_9FLAO|nr:hypothetical protein SAMN04488513_11820 [Pseudozobellia thermophila]
MFLFYRNILDNKKSFILILAITCSIFLIGVSLYFIKRDFFYLTLINPLFSFVVYSGIFSIFNKKLKRGPVDTAFNWSLGLFYDHLFNILYIVLGILTPMLISLFLVDILKN